VAAVSLGLGAVSYYAVVSGVESGVVAAVIGVPGFFTVVALGAAVLAAGALAVATVPSIEPFGRRVLVICAIMLAGSAAIEALPWSATALSWLGLALVLASTLMFQVIFIYALWRAIRGPRSGPAQRAE